MPSPDDLVWVGNWGDGERERELREFLLGPARQLRLSGCIYGVRYPWRARLRVRLSGLRYRGWVANYRAPDVFARHRLTVHVPRRPYVEALPGIPTIRPFEAMACGIPLICAPWEDAEGLFRPGEDYLVAADGKEMAEAMSAVVEDPALAGRYGQAARDFAVSHFDERPAALRVGEAYRDLLAQRGLLPPGHHPVSAPPRCHPELNGCRASLRPASKWQ